MESIVTSWRKRTLSLNGRMLAAKTFILSQIVFQAQAVHIAAKEIKKIERLIYSFVNGAKSLYGPERIARKRLKTAKDQGGINGVDVDTFIKTIQLRQFNKAMHKHKILGLLQNSFRGCDDEITKSVTPFLMSHYRESLKVGIPDLHQASLVSGIPLKILLRPNTRGHSFAMEASIPSLYGLQSAINNNRIPRNKSSVIIKQLPAVIRSLLSSQMIADSQPLIIASLENDLFGSIGDICSAKLRRRFLDLKYQPNPVMAKEVYKQDQWQEPANWQSRLWQIANPYLRSYRLKLLYKDIFSNERRHRFGISDSAACTICGQVETISHQLIECPNARKLWDMYYRITGRASGDLLQVITCTENIENEIIKSIIIKRLIQIDRSQHTTLESLKQEIRHYFRIESCLSQASIRNTQFWINRMQQVEQA